jgi:hypothetical protein
VRKCLLVLILKLKEKEMKKRFLAVLGLIVFVLTMVSVFTLPVRSDSGTCCPEISSDCVIGTFHAGGKYFKSEGPCNPKVI